MAWDTPRCVFFRRINAPRALSERYSGLVAKRNASAARLALGLVFELMTLPPVMQLFWLSPNQKSKWPALSRFVFSVPISLMTFSAVNPSTPSIRVRFHPRHPVQLALDIEAGRVSMIALFAIGSRRRAIAAVLEPLQLGVKGGGKVGHVGGSIVGLRRWKTVPSAIFYKVDYQPVEGEMDVFSGDARSGAAGLHGGRHERSGSFPVVRPASGHGAQDTGLLGSARLPATEAAAASQASPSPG